MTNFMHLLDKKVSETERPKPLPVGTYDTVITGYTTGTSQQKQTPYVEFALKVLSPRDDVDPEEWAQVKNPTEAKLKTQFYLTEDSMWRLQDFLAKAGFDTSSDMSYAEMLAECAGRNIIGIVSHRQSQDGESVFPEVRKFLSQD